MIWGVVLGVWALLVIGICLSQPGGIREGFFK
jgi:hypothetical protein